MKSKYHGWCVRADDEVSFRDSTKTRVAWDQLALGLCNQAGQAKDKKYQLVLLLSY